ncbi:SubName: Full=Related to deacetylase {ECO:0000313/EMBL:CCA69714.1} [Serendipita indica DSM 11827]|nr:SubName: Full=Related to deacetylase {ECO:0000313/EMBL:CCA69714.1} [Serendipita indica DSM 11827]
MARLSLAVLSVFLALFPSALAKNVARDANGVFSTCNHDFAFTWDDGPYEWTEEIVDEFDCMAGKTTLFVSGTTGGCIYSPDNVSRLRYAFEAGHQIASHAWRDVDMNSMTNAQIDEQIQRLDEAIIKILGVRPKVFRAPVTLTSSSVISYIQSKHGKTIVTSDAPSNDAAQGATGSSVYAFFQSLAAGGASTRRISQSTETSQAALDGMDQGSVEVLATAGIRLVTVAQCLDINPYETVGSYGVRDSSWTCDGTWTAPATSTNCQQTYTAQAGENTCSKIAAKFSGLSGSDIYFANPSLNCQDIWQWTSICIPPASGTTTIPCSQTYATQPGENTCSKIATKFGTSAELVSAANRQVNCQDIWTGTPLCIPQATATTSSSTPGPTGTNGCSAYTAQAGDTCTKLATKFGTTVASIKASNPSWLNCDDIWANTPLTICVGSTSTSTSSASTSTSSGSACNAYTAQSGDTCTKLATKFGTTVDSIKASNPSWLNCDDIWANTPLTICAASGSTSTSSSSTSTSSSNGNNVCSSYSAQSGDNCTKLAAKFGTTVALIKSSNPSWLNCDDIWEWTPLTICVPAGATTSTPTDVQTSTSTSTSSSATSTATETCVTKYAAGDNETCITVATKFGLSATDIFNANNFLNCNSIWKFTPICIPPGGKGCTKTINSWPGATCANVATAYGTTESNVRFWNDFVDCNSIWTNTPLCVAH